MQCPNCGKEAINVNGRYVCLDCGIEISPDGATTAPSAAATASVDNHNAASIVPDSVATPPLASTPDPAPAQSPAPEPVSVPPVSTSLNDFTDLNDSNSSQPSAEPVQEAPATAVEPQVAEPVKDYYVNALSQDANQPAASDFPSAMPEPSAGGLPDFPVPTAPAEPAPSEPAVPSEPNTTEPIPSQQPAEAPSPEGISMDGAFMSGSAPEPLAAPVAEPVTAVPAPIPESTVFAPTQAPEPEPVPQAETPMADPNQTPSSESYFQPSSLDIHSGGQTTPQEQVLQPEAPLSTTSQPEPVTTIAPEPAPAEVPSVVPQVETQNPPLAPAEKQGAEIPINVVTPEAPAQVAATEDGEVVDPLAVVSPTPDEVVPAPQPAQQVPSQFPGASSMPSAESVFGSQGQSQPTVPAPAAKKGSNKKLIIILIAVLGGILLVGGLVFAYFAVFAPKSSQQGNGGNTNGIDVVALSDSVSGAMDKTTDVAATYTQTLDFTKATPQDSSQALFFSKPVELKETWAVNSSQDISIDATQNGTPAKRTYIKADSATYVYSNDTKAYVKTDGQNLNPSSVFFPADPRGHLFYVQRVDDFQNQGEEVVGDKTATKIQVVPTKDVVEELLTGSNPAFAKINYTDVNVDNLKVVVWLDKTTSQILKVDVSGSVDVTSDLYNGTVGITANGSYQYQPQTVNKPA